MQNSIEDHEDAGSDVAEAAARPPSWMSYSGYSLDPWYQYPDAGNTGEWYSAASASAERNATPRGTTHLDHHTTPQDRLRRADPPPLYYSHLDTHGQSAAFASTAAGSAYTTTPLQRDVSYQADSTLTLSPTSALPSAPPISEGTPVAAYGGYPRGQRPVHMRSDGRTFPSRRTRPSTIQPRQPREDDSSYPLSQYLHVPGHTLLAPSPATSPVPTHIASPSLTAIHSPTPSSPATQTPFTPKRCGWVGCESDTLFTTESGLMRHLRTIHVSPEAYPCVEVGCPMKFGRNDHLVAHQKRRHGV
ncbi:hypothetical protein BJX68DRAFT_270192 [Aspergillus pseudodeflectus]|uniref:C2H2-type domain-containing protein n=1 Tax=Aspergillus pseudodeflectus TaxID=176178 RepID=A0ABR4JWP4_9EURO